MNEAEKISPYSAATLRGLIQLGRDTRAVCRAIERMECPASVSRRLRKVAASQKTLRGELIADYGYSVLDTLRRIPWRGLPGLLMQAAIAAALAVAFIYGLPA